MAHMRKEDIVASCVDVKMCLLTPLTGTHLWFNVLADIIIRCERVPPVHNTAINCPVCLC